MSDAYAVFGHPVGHSKSPRIHAAFAAATGQDMTYGAVEAPLGGFGQALTAFRASGARGANVTAPFKLDAYASADWLSERARAAGAVNALKFEDGRVLGENFEHALDADSHPADDRLPTQDVRIRRDSIEALEAEAHGMEQLSLIHI